MYHVIHDSTNFEKVIQKTFTLLQIFHYEYLRD